MQCPKCQFDNPAGGKFCLSCGQKLAAPSPPAAGLSHDSPQDSSPVETSGAAGHTTAESRAVNRKNEPASPQIPPTAAVHPLKKEIPPAVLGAGFLVLLGLGGWLAGAQMNQRQPPQQETATTAIVATPDAAADPAPQPSATPIPTRRPQVLPTARPAVSTQDRAAILKAVEDWRIAWQNQNLGDYMATYAPDARIFSNRKWYNRAQYEAHEAELFARGGTLSIVRGDAQIWVNGDVATVTFPFSFQRWGGPGNYRSRGRETFKMRRAGPDTWLITEDIFAKR